MKTGLVVVITAKQRGVSVCTVNEWNGNGYLEVLRDGLFSQFHKDEIVKISYTDRPIPGTDIKLYNHLISYPQNFNERLHIERHLRFWCNRADKLYDYLYPTMDMDGFKRLIVQTGDRASNYPTVLDKALWSFCEKVFRGNFNSFVKTYMENY